jgi:esterase/lipase superfamily enzyme
VAQAKLKKCLAIAIFAFALAGCQRAPPDTAATPPAAQAPPEPAAAPADESATPEPVPPLSADRGDSSSPPVAQERPPLHEEHRPAEKPASADHKVKTPKEAKYHSEIIYFVTDRSPTRSTGVFFGSSRGGSLRYGYCIITIPFSHRSGELERPSWLKLQFSEDANRDVILQDATELKPSEFSGEINSVLGDTHEGRLLLFVHGYNVSFAAAARRTGQLAWDLNLTGRASNGAALFYSWPSRGEAAPYVSDESNAEWTQSDLTEFLADFLATTTARHIYVIAHSMGSRPTLRAIAALSSSHPELLTKIHEIILAAPDIDADTFRRQIAPIFAAHRLAGTLYVSSRDVPLIASMRAHGGYPRLGDPTAGPVVVNGIETIDASAVDDGDFLGHSYFAARPALLEDIFNLMNGSDAGHRFGLTPVDAKVGRYWKLGAMAR